MQPQKYIIILFLFFISVTGVLSTQKAHANTVQDDLIKNASNLIGTPYLFGGQSTNGFDCSGFTQYVFRESTNIDLPRSSDQQFNIGDKVSKSNLQKGDLVFFETYKKGPSHLGIYIGNNKFIHASSSNGVMVSDLDHSYWKPRYLGAKRVIEEPTGFYFDVDKQHWAYKEINYLTKKKVFSVDQDQMFKPNSEISRAEVAVVLERVLGLKSEASNIEINDIKRFDWAENAIDAAVSNGFMKTDDKGDFHPNKALTHEESSLLFEKAFGLTNINTTDKKDKTSRAEFASLLYKALEPNIVAVQPR